MSSLSTPKLDLSQPDKFQMASVVTKNSRLGITSNKRLLVIKKGYLYYYSNVPKKFKGDSSIVQTIHQLPKCSIEIVNIKQIKGYESNSSYFSIEFDQKNMLQREDIRKTMTLEEYNFSPKNSKESIVWQFTCDNQFIKQRWVAALEGLRDYYNKEKKDIEKFFSENKDNNMEMKSSSSGGRNSHVPWRESQSGNNNNTNKRSNDVNYLQLVATKSSDQRGKDNSLSPDNKFSRNNQLNVPGSNSPSRVRGNSSNDKKTPTQFMKQYSPNEPVNKGYAIGSTISVSSSQQDLNSSSSVGTPNNNKIQNSPINNLDLSDVSPNKENTPASNMMFSKTQKVKIQNEMIQEEENESVRTPGPSPVKGLEESSGFEKQGEQFENNLLTLEGKNTKSQPNMGLNFDQNSKDNPQNNNGKGMFHQINEQNEIPLRAKKNDVVNSIININLEEGPKLNNQKKQIIKQKAVRDRNQIQLKSEQLSQSKQQNDLSSTENASFYALHKYLFQSSLSFNQRISTQQLFHKRINQFSSQCVNYLKQYIESLSSSQSQNIQSDFQILSKSNNYTIIKPIFSKIIFKLALVTSQSLSINGEQKIYLDEEAVKNIKRQFKVYSDIEKYVVLNGVKGDNSFRLRVPLMSLIEYKGVVGLAIDQTFVDENEEEDIHTSSKGSISTNEMSKMFHKQIQFLKTQGYQTKDFSFKSVQQSSGQNQNQSYLFLTLLPQIISNKTTKQQVKKSYLKRLMLVKRPQKHHNLQFNPPFTHELITKAHLTHASTSVQSLEQYIFTLNRIQEFKGICPKEEIIDVLKMCVFCKQIRKIYRSAQGEIQETHFLNLVLKEDQQMMKILSQSGCDQIPPLKGVLFNFIEHYLGIKSTVNEKALKDHLQQKTKQNTSIVNSNKLKKTDIVQSTQIHAIVHTYEISKIQLVEAHESMRKFISEQKAHLALQTLKILENLHIEEYPHLSPKQLQLTSFQASLAYLQHDYLKCIEHAKRYEKLMNNEHDPKLFEIYLMMLKSYSHFSHQEFSHTFQKLIKLIQFNYGHNDSVFISVYSISGFFFYEIAQKHQHTPVKANPLYLLSYKLMDQAEKLCLRLFGQTSAQYIDVLMDSVRLYQTKDRNKSQRYSDRARTIIISTQNNHKLAEFFLYELKLKLSLKQYDQCQKLLNQCEELIHTGRFKLDQQKTITVMRIKFELGLMVSDKLYLSSQAVEYLWRSEKGEEKRQSIVLAAKLAKKIKLIKETMDIGEFESSQTYQASSISSQPYDNFAQYRESVVNQVLDILSLTQYRNGYATEQSLMAKIRQKLQDEGEFQSSTNEDKLSILLEKIA